MRTFASVLALVMVGLAGGWLWYDAAADVRHDVAGVVITGAVDPSAVSSDGPQVPATRAGVEDAERSAGGPGSTAASEATETVDAVDADPGWISSVLAASSSELFARADDARQVEARTTAPSAPEPAPGPAAEPAPQPAPEPAPRPVPVQPAPVVPGADCEWDDGEWECDDWDDDDDDWDDDDWDD